MPLKETIFMYIDSYTRLDLMCKVTMAVPIYLNTIQYAMSRRSNTKRKWVTITTQEGKRQLGLIGDRLGLAAEPKLMVDKDCTLFKVRIPAESLRFGLTLLLHLPPRGQNHLVPTLLQQSLPFLFILRPCAC